MFLVTFVRYRPDVHARWVKTEHNAKKKKKDRFFFFCVCSRNCLYNHLQLVLSQVSWGGFTISWYEMWSLYPFRQVLCITGEKGRLWTMELEIHKVLLSKQTNNKNSTKQFSRKRYQNNALGDVEETAVCWTSDRIPAVQTNGLGFLVWRKKGQRWVDVRRGG